MTAVMVECCASNAKTRRVGFDSPGLKLVDPDAVNMSATALRANQIIKTATGIFPMHAHCANKRVPRVPIEFCGS